MDTSWIINIYLWIAATLLLALFFIGLCIFLWFIIRKTHAIVEFKAFVTGKPIALFFQESRYVDWKPVDPDANVVMDKEFGAFIINERATYIDRRTKNVIIPFDASYGASVNVHAAKLADDLQHIIKNQVEMQALRVSLSEDKIEDHEALTVLKTSIHFGAIKNMVTALTPHSINSKIEKVIASRLAGMKTGNLMNIILYACCILGACGLGGLVLWFVLK